MISAREEGQMVDEDVARYSRERQDAAEEREWLEGLRYEDKFPDAPAPKEEGDDDGNS